VWSSSKTKKRKPPPAQGGVHLAGQKPRRGTGNHPGGLLSIHQAPDESFPARDHLDLVEEPPHQLAAAELGEHAVVLFEERVELGKGQVGQAVVIEAHVHRPFGGKRLLLGLLHLAQERGLAHPPHAEHGLDLVIDGGKPCIPWGQAFEPDGLETRGELFLQHRM
jgi:hypothetical protein